MKRLVHIALLTFAWLMFTLPSDAQIKFGIKVGANVSKASINRRLFDSDNRLGFVAGPILDLKVPILGLGFDIAAQYNCRYAQLIASDGTNLVSGTPAIQTIEIPFNAKWTIGFDNLLSVYAAMGPQISWNVGGQSLKDILSINQYNMKDSFFSWNLGAGINFARSFRIGYVYNIAIGATAEVSVVQAVGGAINTKLRNHNHQFFIVHFF